MTKHSGPIAKACVYCEIIRKSHPAIIISGAEDYLAFLDARPVNPGHTLLIPTAHIDYLFDLEAPAYNLLFERVRFIARVLQRAMQAKKIGIAVKGFQVPHAHVHMVPLYNPGELNFSARSSPTTEDLEIVGVRIRAEFEASIDQS